MTDETLSKQIANRFISYARESGLGVGQHLAEQRLADEFRVSRSPVRAALQLLEEMGVVEYKPNRGFFLNKNGDDIAPITATSPAPAADEHPIYFAIAEDRLRGQLPDRITERELMRRYRLPRNQLLQILSRIANEGWIERLPGHGWEFQTMLTSVQGYEAGYRLRVIVEPAALLEPSFKIDRAAFARMRAQQEALLAGDMLRLSPAQLFGANVEFHEMLLGCSGNPYMLDAVQRVNRVRRLIEYRKSQELRRVAVQVREHLRILDLVESGDREAAASFLRQHLQQALTIKLQRDGIGPLQSPKPAPFGTR